MLGGAFSSFMGQIACSVHAVWLLFVKGLLETARSFETVDPVVCEYHALDDALRHERLDHDERFKQQVVARNRGKLVPLLWFRALRTQAGHRLSHTIGMRGDSAQHLTTALSFAIDDLVDAVREALLDRAAMAREHQAGLQLLHLLQALEIAFVTVLTGEGKHVIATEQDARIGIEEHKRIGRMPRHLEDLERAIPDRDSVAFLNGAYIKALFIYEDRLAIAGFVGLRICRTCAHRQHAAEEELIDLGGGRLMPALEPDPRSVNGRAWCQDVVHLTRMVEVLVRQEELELAEIDPDRLECVAHDVIGSFAWRTGIHHQPLSIVVDQIAIGNAITEILEAHMG